MRDPPAPSSSGSPARCLPAQLLAASPSASRRLGSAPLQCQGTGSSALPPAPLSLPAMEPQGPGCVGSALRHNRLSPVPTKAGYHSLEGKGGDPQTSPLTLIKTDPSPLLPTTRPSAVCAGTGESTSYTRTSATRRAARAPVQRRQPAGTASSSASCGPGQGDAASRCHPAHVGVPRLGVDWERGAGTPCRTDCEEHTTEAQTPALCALPASDS